MAIAQLKPERTRLRLGFVPLADALPLIVARAHGHFARYGVEVELVRLSAWASLRDQLAAGVLDAAQMLAPMPLAATLGLDAVGTPMCTALSLNLNGNAITVANALHQRLREQGAPGSALAWARALKRVLDEDRAAGRAPLTFAHVFPYSAQHYELRYWLAAGGVDPDLDLNLVVIPPPQMVAQLQAGRIDGYCVGAPWSELAEHRGCGRLIVRKHEIWPDSPEKVLGVTRAWADAHPRTHLALVTALLEAGQWLGEDAHRREAAQLLVEDGHVEAPVGVVEAGLKPLRFTGADATLPWHSQAMWFMTQMLRWGQLALAVDLSATAATVYRSDLYRAACGRLGLALPAEDRKIEGPWLDGARFDPAQPLARLDQALRLRVPHAQLAALNHRA